MTLTIRVVRYIDIKTGIAAQASVPNENPQRQSQSADGFDGHQPACLREISG